MGLRPRVRVAWVAGFALSPVAQAAPRAVERIDAGPAPRPCAGSPARAPRASRGSGFFDVTRPLRFGGSAVLRFGGSAARRLGGSAAPRLRGSAVRRPGGSAAPRLGGSAASVSPMDVDSQAFDRRRRRRGRPGRETVRAAQYPRRHGMRCIRRAAGRRAVALAPDLRARRERTTAARWPHGQPRDTDIVTRRRRAHRAPARRSLRAHGETPRRRPAHPRTTRCAAAPRESRRGSRRCSTRRECAP